MKLFSIKTALLVKLSCAKQALNMPLVTYSDRELVGLLYMCFNGVSRAKSRKLHLLRAVWHSSEPEALLHFEGGLEAAAANDSEED